MLSTARIWRFPNSRFYWIAVNFWLAALNTGISTAVYTDRGHVQQLIQSRFGRDLQSQQATSSSEPVLEMLSMFGGGLPAATAPMVVQSGSLLVSNLGGDFYSPRRNAFRTGRSGTSRFKPLR